MVLFSVLALCLASASRGNPVGYGLILGTVLMVVPLLMMAAVYWASMLLATVLGGRRSRMVAQTQSELTARDMAGASMKTLPPGYGDKETS